MAYKTDPNEIWPDPKNKCYITFCWCHYWSILCIYHWHFELTFLFSFLFFFTFVNFLILSILLSFLLFVSCSHFSFLYLLSCLILSPSYFCISFLVFSLSRGQRARGKSANLFITRGKTERKKKTSCDLHAQQSVLVISRWYDPKKKKKKSDFRVPNLFLTLKSQKKPFNISMEKLSFHPLTSNVETRSKAC